MQSWLAKKDDTDPCSSSSACSRISFTWLEGENGHFLLTNNYIWPGVLVIHVLRSTCLTIAMCCFIVSFCTAERDEVHSPDGKSLTCYHVVQTIVSTHWHGVQCQHWCTFYLQSPSLSPCLIGPSMCRTLAISLQVFQNFVAFRWLGWNLHLFETFLILHLFLCIILCLVHLSCLDLVFPCWFSLCLLTNDISGLLS